MVAILYPRRLPGLLDVTQPGGTGLPDQGIPVLYSSNSSFVIETHGGGGGGGSFSAGVSTLGNTLGDTGITGSRVVLAGIGNLTLSQATDANGGTISISGGTAGAGFSAGVSGGNTAGATGATGTRLVFAGGNNVTLSQATDVNGGTVTISGANSAAQTVQTQNRFNLTLSGNTAGALQEVSSGTLTLAGGNGVTLSQNGNAITISGSTFSQSVQPETQTFIGGISASNTLYTSGTVNITGSGMVTVQSGTGQRVIINATQSVQTQNAVDVTLAGNTAGALALVSSGTMTLAGGNNITVSQAGNAITISGANAGGAQTAISGLANSQTTYTSGTVSLSEIGAITIRSTTGNQFQFSVNSQSVQPETQTFIGGIVGSNATYTSGTVTITGVGGGVTVSSNTGQRIDISVAAPVAQTGTQFSAGISGGNTSGNSGTVAGRVVFAGGNNVTLSGSTNGVSETITISAFNQSAQTGISSIVASDATYTSGSVQFTGSNMVTVKSSANQRVVIDATQSVQTQNLHNVTLSGNTAGVLAAISSGTMTIAGGNNITVSQAGNAFTISGANIGGAQTGISGIANSQTTYTSGTVSMSELGAITIRSTTGNQYQFSVNSQTAQTGISGLANSQTTYTSGTVSMSELGAITIRSTTGNQYQFSVNAQTGTQFSAGISGGNTAGDTGTVAGRVVFAGGANITVSGSTNGASETISIVGGAGGAFSGGVSNVGNSSGDTGITGSRLVFAGGNSITLSQSTNASGGTITVSAPNASVLSAVAPLSTSTNGSTISILGPAQLSVGFSTAGNTSGDTGFVTGRLALVGSNGITLSGSTNAGSQTITISGVTTAAQTNQSGSAFAVGNTYSSSVGTFDARTLSIRGDGIISVAATNSGWRISASQSAQTGISGLANSQTTYTSGTVSLGELGAITIRSTTGNQYQFSVNAQTAQTGISGLANSQTTYTSGTVSLSELGAITIRSTTGNQYQFSVAAQTVESQSIGASNLGNTLGTSGVASGGQVRAVIIGTSNITVSQSVNGASATLSLIGQPSFSAGLSTGGNTQGNTGVSGTRLVLVATNNITMSQATDASGATISISGQSPTGGQFSAGVSTGGNTAGATGISGSQLVLVGTNNISLSQTTGANGATVSINNTVSAFLAGVSTGGNTTGDTGVTGTRMVFVGSSPISLSQATGANGGTISINAPATSSLSGVSGIVISTNGSTISIGYKQNVADWENMPRQAASLVTHISAFSKTPIYWNDHIDCDLTAKSMAFAISMVTASQPLSLSAHLGIYTIVNSTSANLLGSVSEAYVVSSASSVSLSGVRNLAITGIGTHTALSTISGGEYVIGMMFSATATNAMNASLLGASGGAGALGMIYPGTNNLSTGTSQGIQALAGRGSTTVNAMPSAMSAADLVNQGTAASMPLHPWIYIRS